MKKKVLFVILAAMLAVSGCGSKTETGQEQQTQVMEERQVEVVPEKETVVAGEISKETVENTKTDAPEASDAEKETGETEETKKTKNGKEAVKESKTPESSADAKTGKDTSKKPEKTTAGTGEKGQEASGTQTSNTGTGGNKAPAESKPHTCTFDGGNVTTAASCSSEGVKTYTCTGCGKTKTESIAKTSHNYVTENTGATCTEAAKTKTVCSVCGDVQSETSSGSPLAHNYTKSYWPSGPSCTTSGHYNLRCTVCGANGGEGEDPMLPHTPVSREDVHGTYCNELTIIITECGVCGVYLGREAYDGTEHEWTKGTSGPIWSEEAGDFIEYETTYCSRCGVHQ